MIERIYTTIRDAAYEASADNATEKGAFSHFERDKYMQGAFIKHLPKAIQEKIKKQGIRNAVLLTQAPTGTTSLFAGVSSGIEPVYDFAMVRRDRTGEHILYHPLLQDWRDEHPNEPTPAYFVAANDLTPEQHVRVQAAVQKYTDSSISKTVNAPNSHTVEDVQTLYRLAYELGCKGVTYFRDGSRTGVLSHMEEKKPEAQEQQAARVEPVTSIQDGVKPRPPVVYGYTRQVNAPEGKINVTINSDEHGPLGGVRQRRQGRQRYRGAGRGTRPPDLAEPAHPQPALAGRPRQGDRRPVTQHRRQPLCRLRHAAGALAARRRSTRAGTARRGNGKAAGQNPRNAWDAGSAGD